MQNEIAVNGGQTGLVINAKAKKGIDLVFDGVKASTNLAKAVDNAQGVSGLIMQGLCIALENGATPEAVMREIAGRKHGQAYLDGMWKSDKANLAKVCMGIMQNVMVTNKDAKVNIRSLMKAKVSKQKDGTTKTTWPSLQGLAGKIREAEKSAKLLSDDAATRKAAEAEARKAKLAAQEKRASGDIKIFGSLSNAVKALAIAVRADDESAKLDKEKAAVLAYVAGLNPKAITALIESLKIKA